MKTFNRLFRQPFVDQRGYLLIHCSHHKTGTVWFKNILNSIANYYGLPYIENNKQLISKCPSIFFDDHSKIDCSEFLQPYRGSHMIRDPRDIVISGYYYHLWTKEAWANTRISELGEYISDYWPLLPVDDIKNMTYKEYLNSLDKEQGLIAEMQRSSSTDIKDMMSWDYNNQNILNFKYETIMQNEEGTLKEIFEFYGFNDKAVKKCIEISEKFSFKKNAKNSSGGNERSHLRSGKLQQWCDEFSNVHKEYFKKLHGDDLVIIGYEKDLSW